MFIKNTLNYFNTLTQKYIFNNYQPKDITTFTELTKDSYAQYNQNSFIIFKSLDEIFYLIYSTKNQSIISYNLINSQKINEIKKAHNDHIRFFKYFLDNQNKRELILSISNDNNIKLWNIKNYQCLFNIKNNPYNNIYPACLFNNNNQTLIITNYSTQFMNIYNINGNKIGEIDNGSGDTIFYVENYYYEKLKKNYIIICTNLMIKSYDFNKKRIYHEYHNVSFSNNNCIIKGNEDNIKLIVPCRDNIIRVWDFNSGELLKNIKIENMPSDYEYNLKCFCNLNDDYIVTGHNNKIINIININNGKIYQKLIGHKNKIIHIQNIILSNLGECLVSQGYRDDQIKIWKLNINFK